MLFEGVKKGPIDAKLALDHLDPRKTGLPLCQEGLFRKIHFSFYVHFLVFSTEQPSTERQKTEDENDNRSSVVIAVCARSYE